MGNNYSQYKEARFPESKPPLFTLAITGYPNDAPKKTILLTYCPPEVRDVIRTAIIDCWPAGIKTDEEINPSCYKFKMHDYPFGDNIFTYVIKVKEMMGQIVARVGRMAWIPLVGCDTQAEEDISTVIFYKGVKPIFTLKVHMG